MATVEERKQAFKFGYLKKMAENGVTPSLMQKMSLDLKELAGTLTNLLPLAVMGVPYAVSRVTTGQAKEHFQTEPEDVEEAASEILQDRYERALATVQEKQEAKKYLDSLQAKKLKSNRVPYGSRLLR